MTIRRSLRHLGPLALSGAVTLAAWPAQAQKATAASTTTRTAPPAPRQDKASDSGSDWHVIGAIAAYSVAALATGGYFYTLVENHQLQSDQGYTNYAAGFSSGDVCDHARNGDTALTGASADHAASICDRSDTMHTLSLVSVVTALVGVGTGTALLLTRPSPGEAAAARAPRLALTPVIGVHGAAAQLDYRF